MIDIRPYLEIGDPMTEFVRQRIPNPKLDGLTTRQRWRELETTNGLERMAAKQYAKASYYQNRRGNNEG